MPSLYTSTGRSEVTGASGAIVDNAGSDSFPFAMLYTNSRRKIQKRRSPELCTMTKLLKTKRKIRHWTDQRQQLRRAKVEKTKRVATRTATRANERASEREWRLLQLGSKKYRAGEKKKKRK